MADPDLLTQIDEAMAEDEHPAVQDQVLAIHARTLLAAAREEIARLREQVRIAREALASIGRCECGGERTEGAKGRIICFACYGTGTIHSVRTVLAALSATTEVKETHR